LRVVIDTRSGGISGHEAAFRRRKREPEDYGFWAIGSLVWSRRARVKPTIE